MSAIHRSRLGLVAGLTTLAAAALGTVAVASASAAPAHAPTTTAVVRPVTASGHVARGWHVVDTRRSTTDCTERSFSAVDRGIAACGSTADNTPVCWRSATPGRVLCLGPADLGRHTLRQYYYRGSFATAPAEGSRPLTLAMRNGMTLGARVGGAWNSVEDRPGFVGWYYEFAPSMAHTTYGPSNPNGAVNRTGPAWFVRMYDDTSKPGYYAYVERAYYVGNA